MTRWVQLGVGCSKIPDHYNVGLMEDLATLRISGQHVRSWLHHGLVTKEQVYAVLDQMCAGIDQQNVSEKNYAKLTRQSPAYQAAVDIMLGPGSEMPNGYTDGVLKKWRLAVKAGGKGASFLVAKL